MKERLYFVVIAIVVIVLGGSFGYYLILNGKFSFFDCLYMTIISLTTVGYGEIFFNPPPDVSIEADMSLIVMGEVDQIIHAQKLF